MDPEMALKVLKLPKKKQIQVSKFQYVNQVYLYT